MRNTTQISNTPPFRPPAEADSLILQMDVGCPWNKCTFCGMYKHLPYKKRSLQDITQLINEQARLNPMTRRIFLADGDPLLRPFPEVRKILQLINQRFSHLTRINAYATGTAINQFTATQWQQLKQCKLHTLYLGLESGDDETLKRVQKHETAKQMLEASALVQQQGLRLSVMILLGLAGKEHSERHIHCTADILNQMQPRLLSCLRVIPIPGTAFHSQIQQHIITPLSEYDIVLEMIDLLQQLKLTQTIFRTNHSSNITPLEGRLPKDAPLFIYTLNSLLQSNRLDKEYAPTPLWL